MDPECKKKKNLPSILREDLTAGHRYKFDGVPFIDASQIEGLMFRVSKLSFFLNL